MNIQFLILSDGASARYLGVNPVVGLQRLGIKAEYYFRSRNTGVILPSPDYVFFLKPNIKDLTVGDGVQFTHTTNSSVKFVLIINDQRLPIEQEQIFDFFVSPSLDWQQEYIKRHPNKPCYLINEEIDYYTTKIHKPSKELKVVTTGYAVNLIQHFLPIVPMIKEVTKDITVVTNGSINELKMLENAGCKIVPFLPHYTRMLEENYDKLMVEQFLPYDVGIVTQYSDTRGSGRTSNRVKLLTYAGLPVVCTNSANHRDLWFNGGHNNNLKVVEDIDWITHLIYFQNVKRRQFISNFNSMTCKINGGIIKSAESFLEAIKQYEKR